MTPIKRNTPNINLLGISPESTLKPKPIHIAFESERLRLLRELCGSAFCVLPLNILWNLPSYGVQALLFFPYTSGKHSLKPIATVTSTSWHRNSCGCSLRASRLASARSSTPAILCRRFASSTATSVNGTTIWLQRKHNLTLQSCRRNQRKSQHRNDEVRNRDGQLPPSASIAPTFQIVSLWTMSEWFRRISLKPYNHWRVPMISGISNQNLKIPPLFN